jgi:two-component system, response regulator YesN
MLKLLIVDDEKITRDSLKLYIPWNEIGIDTVDTAKNGIVGLELAKELKPDIILCDIRMPKMDGIEFTSRLREFDQNCKIIFISAYADKEYLKSAINLKAVSYIEKPILMDELKDVIKKTANLCIEEANKRMDAAIIENRIIDNLPYIRQKLTMDLINKTYDISEIKEKYGSSLLQFPLLKTFTTAYIILNWKLEINVEERISMQQSLLNSFYSKNFLSPSRFLVGLINNNGIAFIFEGDCINKKSDNPYELEELLTYLLKASLGNYTVSIGIGPICTNLDEIPSSYQEAIRASNLQFYVGANKIIHAMDNNCSHILVDKKTYVKFKNLLKKDSTTDVCDLIDKLTMEQMNSKDPDICYVRNIYFKLLLTIFEVSRERNLISPKEEEEANYIWQEIANFNTLGEISDYLISNITVIFQKGSHGNLLNDKIEKITKYVKENYNDRNLSVQNIADKVYLSHTYLCALFKKATGKTVNEYITEVRIENAKNLLKHSSTKLYEITLNIGLTDSNYFCSIFKKNTGLTPTEFRERCSYEEKVHTKS